jgi:predicted nucleic acid-binding protein
VSTLLVVDANPILSALLGGAAREVVFSRQFVLHSTQHTLFETAKYLARLAAKLRVPELDMYRALQLLPISAHQPDEYADCLAAARTLIEARDPNDVDILALTMHLGCAIWTEDRDFEDVPGISVCKTADLLKMLQA